MVYVWTKDGKYVGQVYRAGFGQIEVLADDEEDGKKLKGLLLDARALSENHDFELRSGQIRKFYEFATDEWIDMAALLVLPPAGYRVHIIQNPPSDPFRG